MGVSFFMSLQFQILFVSLHPITKLSLILSLDMKNKTDKNSPIFRSRGGLWILICAALVLEGTACVQYFYSRAGIKNEAERRAASELRRAELEINVITAQVEMAVKTMAILAQRDLQSPDSMMNITKLMVERTPNMVGAAIAFKENFYPKYGKWFEAYSSEMTHGVKTGIVPRQIGSSRHNYFESEWFEAGMTVDSCWWCEPYFDEEGAGEMLVSCSYPVKNYKGEIVAVALADISLKHLQRLSEYLQIYPNSYYSITSGNGTAIVPTPDTIPGLKYHIFNEFIDATGWSMSIIIPDDVIYADLKRIGLIVTIMMILGLTLLVFIMYRSAKGLLSLISVSNRQERLESELDIAKKIQMAMLPTRFPPFPGYEDLHIFGTVIPAKQVGGDIYDFHVNNRKLYFCIGDVSGKGVPAALVMAVTRSLFRTISQQEDSPEIMMKEMNKSLAELSQLNMFVTFFLGVLNLDNGEMKYCNAGHNAPIVIGDNSAPQALNITANLPLGVLDDFNFIGQETVINPNDTLFLYTDGLTEAENELKQLFGEAAMMQNLQITGSKLTPNQLLEQMQNAVNTFVGNAEQSDDLTMFAIKYMPGDNTSYDNTVNIKNNTLPDHTQYFSIVMRNDIEQIPTLAEWIDSLQLPESMVMSINLALEEIVSNVMLYAYPKDKSGQVLINAEKREHSITFIVSDSGIAFDPTQHAPADITLSAEERQIGGLGIHLVRQIMDKIEYQRKGKKNILTMVKEY